MIKMGALIGAAAGAAGGSWLINERNDDRYYDRDYDNRRYRSERHRGYGRYGSFR